MNHLANGRSHSSVVVNGVDQSSRSRARFAQNASKSASASSYRAAVALAWAANAGSGGNVRDSARRFSISGDGTGGSTLTGSLVLDVGWRRPSYRAAPGARLGRADGAAARLLGALGQVVLRRARRVEVAGCERVAVGLRARTTRCGRGISMPCSLKAASRRLRKSPAAAHWSAARTVPRILSVTPYSASACDPLDARRLEDAPLPDRVGGHLAADVVDDLDRPLDVRAVGDRDVLVDARPDAGQVRGDLDLAVGHGVDDAVEVAQRRPPQGEVLDRARRRPATRTTSPLANWFSIRISAPLR